MARKLKSLTSEQVEQVENLAQYLTQEQLADYLGIGRTTFHTIMEREPEIAERYKRGKAKAIGTVAKSLLMQAREGNTTAMIFYLKTQGGWRETNRVEMSGPDGGTVQIEDVTRDADKFTSRVLGLAARLAESGTGGNDAGPEGGA